MISSRSSALFLVTLNSSDSAEVADKGKSPNASFEKKLSRSLLKVFVSELMASAFLSMEIGIMPISVFCGSGASSSSSYSSSSSSSYSSSSSSSSSSMTVEINFPESIGESRTSVLSDSSVDAPASSSEKQRAVLTAKTAFWEIFRISSALASASSAS